MASSSRRSDPRRPATLVDVFPNALDGDTLSFFGGII